MDDQMMSRESAQVYNRNPLTGTELGDKVEQKTHQISDRLTYAYQRASTAFVGYLTFKETRGSRFGEATGVEPIRRPPSYPDSHIMTFSILASMVLIEGLANAYFFSKGSDLGLLGGWIQAITVAATNIAVSFFLIGFLGLRMVQNPHRVFSFVAGIVLIIAASLSVLLINTSAAQYRDVMEREALATEASIDQMLLSFDQGGQTNADLDETGTAYYDEPAFVGDTAPVSAPKIGLFSWSPESVANGPFETLEALLLFILGMTFAVIAAFKGATFDDRLVGYGSAHRRLVSASSYLTATLKQLPPEAMIGEEDSSGQNSTRARAIALKHEIELMFADEADEALEVFQRRRAERRASDGEEAYNSPPPPRA